MSDEIDALHDRVDRRRADDGALRMAGNYSAVALGLALPV